MRKHRTERSLLVPVLAAAAGLLILAGLTVAYVSWSVTASQHRWCDTINLLNSAPAPSGSPGKNPSRAYLQKLSADFEALRVRLGC